MYLYVLACIDLFIYLFCVFMTCFLPKLTLDLLFYFQVNTKICVLTLFRSLQNLLTKCLTKCLRKRFDQVYYSHLSSHLSWVFSSSIKRALVLFLIPKRHQSNKYICAIPLLWRLSFQVPLL